ncbi:MAG TPA: hypothetical protein VND19_03115 [Acetobacteraceae bacterium]|nr:hypothetical protein [Acetobacteraceae bacterium]
MPFRSAGFCALLVLAGCATQVKQPLPKARAARPAGVRGTILAMRPVPAESPEPARILLSSLGSQGAQPAAGVFEFIVRTASGSTIAVVQPRTVGLRPGEPVSILRGQNTRIEAPPPD